MSFDNDPFRNMQVHIDRGRYSWHCENCGADSDRVKPPVSLIGVDTLDSLVKSWYSHLTNSHQIRPAETKDWGDY